MVEVGVLMVGLPFIVVLLIMLSMALKLYFRWRSLPYLYLIVSFSLGIVVNLLFLVRIIRVDSYELHFLLTLLFFLIQTSLYHYYKPKDKGALRRLLEANIIFLLVGIGGIFLETFTGLLVIALLVIIFSIFYYLYLKQRMGSHTAYLATYVIYAFVSILVVINYLIDVQIVKYVVIAALFLYLYFIFTLFFARIIDTLQAIQYSSAVDGLTGLFNRREFNRKAAQAINAKMNVSVIFIDIDNFKKLNDTEGHQAGDQILKQVAEILKQELDGIGIAGRYGGEELVGLIIEPDVDPERVCENIRVRVEQETIVTVSIGFSSLNEEENIQELLKQADEAMYEAKTTGKNKVVEYRK